MIDVHCPDCGRTLIGSRQVVALRGGDAGIEMTYVCWCGRPGAELIRRAGRVRPLLAGMNRARPESGGDMYNIHHTASTPGAADAFRPSSGRRGPRALRRRRGRPPRVEAVEPVKGGRLEALR